MTRTLMICPWFGPLPDWMATYQRNIQQLQPHGYDWLITHDLSDFNRRVKRYLGIDSPVIEGSATIHAFRPALGVLYADEANGYDFWGHTDFDVVYGRVWEWLTEPFLAGVDIFANHHDYISGPWTIYRNIAPINDIFRQHDGWQQLLTEGANTGWAEVEFTQIVDALHDSGQLRRVYAYWQTRDLNRFDTLRWDGDRLMEGSQEVFMAHFRRLRPKVYPPQLI